VSVAEALLQIVSEKTGYPTEMLDLDLDLEAELSIDSIKRIEILGTLGKRLGFAAQADEDRDAMIEKLAAKKTLRGIIEWLHEREHGAERASDGAPAGAAPPGPSPRSGDRATAGASDLTSDARGRTRRFLLQVDEAPRAVANGVTLDGKHLALTDGGPLTELLAMRLTEAGATVRLLEPGDEPGDVDGLLHLSSLREEGPADPAKELFVLAQRALATGAYWIVAVTGLGGTFGHGELVSTRGAGVAGLIKSIAREHPESRVCVIDTDPRDALEEIADRIAAELIAADHLVEVGHAGGVRRVLSVVAADEPPPGPAPALDERSVVLVTGGARGITARVAVELAARHRCRLELVGRSPLPPEDEDPFFAGADDLPALRRRLLERGPTSPREVEESARRILADREIRATLDAIREAGGDVGYHTVDVRDAGAFGALVDALYARHGRIDGVVHGAGVIEDKLLKHKTLDSFERVYDTKVIGARTLAARLRDDVRFVVFFSSVSGAFGNRGQADYAAANDAVDKLALDLRRRLSGRVVSINWGPWGGTGMVSEELEREYARRGVGLIDPGDGVRRLVLELSGGAGAPGQVVLMSADARAMAAMADGPAAEAQ
jgi:NAD(P)-dependent dehydrogenase (short-subunit alcohol dehydrogenase family)